MGKDLTSWLYSETQRLDQISGYQELDAGRKLIVHTTLNAMASLPMIADTYGKKIEDLTTEDLVAYFHSDQYRALKGQLP